jgi:Family of unknown function (DUF6226)
MSNGDSRTPAHAYGRVTNRNRFAVLHDVAAVLLERLERDLEVQRQTGYGLDLELEDACPPAHPTVRFSPLAVNAAPLTVTFTSFPGLHVRFGLWCTRAFPACGCDACDETGDELTEALTSAVESLVHGRFREEISIASPEAAWYEWKFWANSSKSSSISRLDPEHARRLLSGSDKSVYDWAPWPRRTEPVSR